MKTLKRWFPVIIGSSLVVLLVIGFLTMASALAQGPGGMMNEGLWGQGRNGGFGPGQMMGNRQNFGQTTPCEFAPGSMMGQQQGHMMGGMMGGGMMFNSNSPFVKVEPLSLTEASEAVEAYVATLNDSNLAVAEVMIFDNQAYAEIVEKGSGIGAMEVLVDPTSLAVYPEMGPNMMWNLKYGMMAGFGGQGMMNRGGFAPNGMVGPSTTAQISAEMPIDAATAVETAQIYLDTYYDQTGLTVDDQAFVMKRGTATIGAAELRDAIRKDTRRG
jgi:hypothetical protein